MEQTELIQEEAEKVRRRLDKEKRASRRVEEQLSDMIMESEEDQDLETELREIYNSIFAKTEGMSTPRREDTPIIINTPTRKTSGKTDVHIGIAKLPTEMIYSKNFGNYLEKNKIARVQYLATEDHTHIDAIIVTVTQLPKYLKFKEQQIPITKAEEMIQEQRLIFKNIVE